MNRGKDGFLSGEVSSRAVFELPDPAAPPPRMRRLNNQSEGGREKKKRARSYRCGSSRDSPVQRWELDSDNYGRKSRRNGTTSCLPDRSDQRSVNT